MNKIIPMLFRTALISAVTLVPTVMAESEPRPGQEQKLYLLNVELEAIQSSNEIQFMNWSRERARKRDASEGWIKFQLSAEQMAEVKPIFARMKVNPKAGQQSKDIVNAEMASATNWGFKNERGHEFFVSQTYGISSDENSGSSWLLSAEDIAALNAISEKYVAAAKK